LACPQQKNSLILGLSKNAVLRACLGRESNPHDLTVKGF
jgi:hypothetical protein